MKIFKLLGLFAVTSILSTITFAHSSVICTTFVKDATGHQLYAIRNSEGSMIGSPTYSKDFCMRAARETKNGFICSPFAVNSVGKQTYVIRKLGKYNFMVGESTTNGSQCLQAVKAVKNGLICAPFAIDPTTGHQLYALRNFKGDLIGEDTESPTCL